MNYTIYHQTRELDGPSDISARDKTEFPLMDKDRESRGETRLDRALRRLSIAPAKNSNKFANLMEREF